MLARMVSNSRPQVMHLSRPRRVLGLPAPSFLTWRCADVGRVKEISRCKVVSMSGKALEILNARELLEDINVVV